MGTNLKWHINEHLKHKNSNFILEKAKNRYAYNKGQIMGSNIEYIN